MYDDDSFATATQLFSSRFCHVRVLDDVVHTAPTIGSNVEEFTRGNIKFLMWCVPLERFCTLTGVGAAIWAAKRACATRGAPILSILMYCAAAAVCCAPQLLKFVGIAQVIIFVVDSSDRKRIGLAHDTLNDVLQAEALTGGVLRARALMRRPSLLTLSAAAPLLVFANKQDVAGRCGRAQSQCVSPLVCCATQARLRRQKYRSSSVCRQSRIAPGASKRAVR